ncbi:MAG: class E sortase, partial [Acidimicrobiia bacterium]|nr:class E sortase [Acidimicrobiia bacterium]
SVDPLDHILQREPTPDSGLPVGTIRIPEIGVHWTVVEGVSRNDLKSGAGHMPTTPLPGQPGNAVVSGHRTTYGAPFNELDELVPGDLIYWDSPVIGTHTYAVTELIVVRPTELWVTDPRPGAWLTLTTCNPEFSAAERLIVFAELVDGPNAAVILDT